MVMYPGLQLKYTRYQFPGSSVSSIYSGSQIENIGRQWLVIDIEKIVSTKTESGVASTTAFEKTGCDNHHPVTQVFLLVHTER